MWLVSLYPSVLFHWHWGNHNLFIASAVIQVKKSTIIDMVLKMYAITVIALKVMCFN